MITRLTLENWRAFEELDVRFGPGTTFVVARNGIGKSSVIEAARWALFGDDADVGPDPVRLGASVASATVELTLPSGTQLTISRVRPRRPTAANPSSCSATLEGRSISAEELRAIVVEEYGAAASFLARVTTLLRDDFNADASELNLDSHICRFLGVDHVHDLIAALKLRQKSVEGNLRAVKQSEGISPGQLRTLKRQAEIAQQEASAAHEALTEAQALVDAAAETVRNAESYEAWRGRTRMSRSELETLALELSDRTSSSIDASHLAEEVERLEEEALRRIDFERRRASELEGRADAIRKALELLTAGTGECPVCRRPLAPEEVADARATHERDIAAIEHEISRVDTRAEEEQVSFLRETRRRVATLEVDEPEPQALVLGDAKERLVELEATLGNARQSAVEKRAESLAATRAVDDAEQRIRDSERLALQLKALGLVTASIDASERAVADVLDAAYRPIASDVSDRWNRLFEDRGQLQLSSKGALSRQHLGGSLPFEAFSTGEKMGAQLLLRMMILAVATKADFCWIDEPLEHLDPVARREVASMLAATPATSGIRQLLVTTYEEPLARKLSDGLFGDASVVYLRTPTISTTSA